MSERAAGLGRASPVRARERLRRAAQAFRRSLRLRLILLFLVLALAIAAIFVGALRQAFSIGWRDLTRPLVDDYVMRLVQEIGSPPDIERARALSQRLPVSIRISGPTVNWQSEERLPGHDRWFGPPSSRGPGDESHADEHHPERDFAPALLSRRTSDGHRIELGLRVSSVVQRPRNTVLFALGGMLLLTALAYAYIRHLLRPLDDIRAAAGRFGRGEFGEPIRIRHRDELGALASDINVMAADLHGMLEAKRALLLAISHELRSPLTRARLNTELLPEQGPGAAERGALIKDLSLMGDLIRDLLESERLAGRHQALQRTPVHLPALAREVLDQLPEAQTVTFQAEEGLPLQALDAPRIRLLIRNLLDNALRHTPAGAAAPVLSVRAVAGQGIELAVRDFGPGVSEHVLPRLAEAFYRPDEDRGRDKGGVGLGLYLCRLVALAHGADWQVHNAAPGLAVVIRFLPPHRPASEAPLGASPHQEDSLP